MSTKFELSEFDYDHVIFLYNTYYILIYNKRKGDNLVAWSYGPKAYHPLDRILNK